MNANLPHDDTRAKTLKEAYQVCNLGALEGDAQEKYYVDLSRVRDPRAIDILKTQLNLANPGDFKAVLFAGHRGSGKSTELLRIKSELEKDYRVIYLKADDILDVNDVDYIDLYLALIRHITQESTNLRLSLDPTLINNFEMWFKEITKETEEKVEKYGAIDTEAGIEIPFLAKLVAKLSAQIKGSHNERINVRQTLQQEIGVLQDNMNRLLLDAFEKLRIKYRQYSKGFLVIFDNLDRLSPKVADHLYFDYAPQLKNLKCTLIYTVPISVIYSIKNVENAFGNLHVVPMVNIYKWQNNDLKINDDTLRKYLSQLVTKRIDYKLVFAHPKLVMDLLRASGGHVRQLMQMLVESCLVATSRNVEKIEQEDIEYTIKQQQISFDRIIPDDYYPLLVDVYHNKRVRQTENGQRMLFNLSVLEYNGQDRWNYINPVILTSKQFQKALQQN